MLVWGSKTKVQTLASSETKYCPTCEKDRAFSYNLSYKLNHLWYALRWVTAKKYFEACDVCARGQIVDGKALEEALEKNPISAFDRYSVFVATGLAIAFLMYNGVL